MECEQNDQKKVSCKLAVPLRVQQSMVGDSPDASEKRLINVFALKMSDTYVSREDRLTQAEPSRFDSEAMNALKRISTKQANADSFLSGDNPVQSPLFIEISRRLNKS